MCQPTGFIIIYNVEAHVCAHLCMVLIFIEKINLTSVGL